MVICLGSNNRFDSSWKNGGRVGRVGLLLGTRGTGVWRPRAHPIQYVWLKVKVEMRWLQTYLCLGLELTNVVPKLYAVWLHTARPLVTVSDEEVEYLALGELRRVGCRLSKATLLATGSRDWRFELLPNNAPRGLVDRVQCRGLYLLWTWNGNFADCYRSYRCRWILTHWSYGGGPPMDTREFISANEAINAWGEHLADVCKAH